MASKRRQTRQAWLGLVTATLLILATLVTGCSSPTPAPSEGTITTVMTYPAEWGKVVSIGGHCQCLVTTVDSAGIARAWSLGWISTPFKVVPVAGIPSPVRSVVLPDGVTTKVPR